jgi:hypothetical protein
LTRGLNGNKFDYCLIAKTPEQSMEKKGKDNWHFIKPLAADFVKSS